MNKWCKHIVWLKEGDGYYYVIDESTPVKVYVRECSNFCPRCGKPRPGIEPWTVRVGKGRARKGAIQCVEVDENFVPVKPRYGKENKI